MIILAHFGTGGLLGKDAQAASDFQAAMSEIADAYLENILAATVLRLAACVTVC